MNLFLAEIIAQRNYVNETWDQYIGRKPKNYNIEWRNIRFVHIAYDGDATKCIVRCRSRARKLHGNFWEFYCTLDVPLKIDNANITVLSPLHLFRFNHNYAYDRDEIPDELHVIEFDFRSRKIRMKDPKYKNAWKECRCVKGHDFPDHETAYPLCARCNGTGREFTA